MKHLLLSLFLLTPLIGCSPKPVVNGSLYNSPGSPQGAPMLLGLFKGVLPCADCPGIETELSLYHANIYTDEGTYRLKLTYLDRNVKPLVTEGDWTMLRGDADDENASVYQLDPDHPDKSLYYLRVNSNELLQLDKDEKKIDSGLNFKLQRVLNP